MKNTKIGYCDHTFSPWYGCTKTSPGCDHCFAERWAKRFGMCEWGPGKPRRLASEAKWREPLQWEREAVRGAKPNWECIDAAGVPAQMIVHPRVLVDLCDWLDPEVPVEWLRRFRDLIRSTPNLRWLCLTKRPEEFKRRMPWPNQPLENLWFGVSVEDQPRAEERLAVLRDIPAAHKWASFEPLLELVCAGRYLYDGIEYAVIGGETGPSYREMPLAALERLVEDCIAASIRVHVKQDSGPRPGMQGRIPDRLWEMKALP